MGTVIVDVMTLFGNPPPAGTAQTLTEQWGFLNFLVNESSWAQTRQWIYFGPGQSHPLPVPSEDLPLLWESNFDSLAEYQAHWVVQGGRWGAASGASVLFGEQCDRGERKPCDNGSSGDGAGR